VKHVGEVASRLVNYESIEKSLFACHSSGSGPSTNTNTYYPGALYPLPANFGISPASEFKPPPPGLNLSPQNQTVAPAASFGQCRSNEEDLERSSSASRSLDLGSDGVFTTTPPVSSKGALASIPTSDRHNMTAARQAWGCSLSLAARLAFAWIQPC
jgi:hypothetical protein